MAQVLIMNSTNEDIFYCGQCKLIFNSLAIYLAHKNDCRKFCIAVEEPCQNIADKAHEASRSCSFSYNKQKGPHPEKSCNKYIKLTTKTQLTTILLGQPKMQEKLYQCVICGRCFVQNSHLQRHILTHRVWPDGISKTTARTIEADLLSYSCLYCDLTVHTFNQFKVHLKTHQGLKKFKCIQNQCNSFYETIELLMNHVSNTHKTVIFWCYYCNKIFHSLKEISVHYQSSNKKCSDSPLPQAKFFKCTQCDAVFRKSEKLSLHMLTESHKKVCIHCNKMFSSDKRLRLHLQVPRKLKPLQCNFCSQRFHMKKYLTAHLLNHGAKKYGCNICQTLFKRQDSLQRHMKSHQTRKKYKCPFTDSTDCKKEFSRSDKFKLHLRSHTKNNTTVTSPINRNQIMLLDQ